MKKYIIVFVMGVMVSGYSLGQKSSNAKVESHAVYTFNPEGWTLQQCENHLQKLEEKKTYFESNPEEKAQAEKEGWFEMAENEEALVRKRMESLRNTKK